LLLLLLLLFVFALLWCHWRVFLLHWAIAE